MPSLPRTPSRLRRAAFLPIGTRGPPCALPLSIIPARLSSLCQSNSSFDFTRLARPPTKHTDELLLLPTFQQTCPTKPNSLGHRFSGTAFGWSSFLTFVSRRSLPLRSAPAVNTACAAPRGS